MITLGLMVRDRQTGETFHIGNNPPRKWLLRHFCRQHATKIYRYTKDGRRRHIGYIIAGRWLDVFRVCSWKEPEGVK